MRAHQPTFPQLHHHPSHLEAASNNALQRCDTYVLINDDLQRLRAHAWRVPSRARACPTTYMDTRHSVHMYVTKKDHQLKQSDVTPTSYYYYQ
jgi:hypothetical protein